MSHGRRTGTKVAAICSWFYFRISKRFAEVEDIMTEQLSSLEEAHRMIEWLKAEVERQRSINSELRRAVADMARTFQETLARANEAAESGDIERVKRITFENRQAWQQYLQTIVKVANSKRDS